jgi:DNA-binding LacI/PurR family transcriptional regulator
MPTQKQIIRKSGTFWQLVNLVSTDEPQLSKASPLRTGIIALCIPNQISTHYRHVARELNRLVRCESDELIISEMDATEAMQTLSNVPVDGVIAVDIPEQARTYRQMLAARSIPLVSMGANCPSDSDSVHVDLEAGTNQVMTHLLKSGYRRIAHATFVRRNHAQTGRCLGYEEAMHKAGLKPEFIYYPLTKELRPVTRQFIQDYIRQHGCPEAIFCHSDDAALGIYRGLCDLKLRVPADVALVGCDGIEDTEYLDCPLTTLVQPVEEMCAVAWKFLKNRLERPRLRKQTRFLKPKLAIRESSSRPANAAKEALA